MAINGRYVSEAEFFVGCGGEDVTRELQPDEAVLQHALDEAEDEVDAWVSPRYFMPTLIAESPIGLKSLVFRVVRLKIKENSVAYVHSEVDKGDYASVRLDLKLINEDKTGSPIINGLVERSTDHEFLIKSSARNVSRTPIQNDRMAGMRPFDDVILEDDSNNPLNHFHFHNHRF